jgi:hypothetical protein
LQRIGNELATNIKRKITMRNKNEFRNGMEQRKEAREIEKAFKIIDNCWDLVNYFINLKKEQHRRKLNL